MERTSEVEQHWPAEGAARSQCDIGLEALCLAILRRVRGLEHVRSVRIRHDEGGSGWQIAALIPPVDEQATALARSAVSKWQARFCSAATGVARC